jgi:hypothetical protein
VKLLKQKFTYYQKLHIATLVEHRHRRSDGAFLGESKQHYEVLSSILGRCGHRHRSMDAARPCLLQMKRMMKDRRQAY